MAAGDVIVFEEFVKDLADEVHDFVSGDTIKCALLKAAASPAASQATPTYSDFSGNECSGTGYSAGGSAVTYTYVEADGTATLDFSAVTFAINSAGPTDARYALFYNDSAANKNAIACMDFAEDKSMVTGNIVVDANASGLLTISVANS